MDSTFFSSLGNLASPHLKSKEYVSIRTLSKQLKSILRNDSIQESTFDEYSVSEKDELYRAQ